MDPVAHRKQDLDYLSEQEKDAVEKFLDNEVQREAVKKVLLSGIYRDGKLEKDKPADPLKNFILGQMTQPNRMMLPDKEYGQWLKSIIQGVSMVESGFELLENCRKVDVKEKKKVNKAR